MYLLYLTNTHKPQVPLWTFIPKPSDCQPHLPPFLMLFQPSRLIQGHEHQGSLFVLCANVCARVCVHSSICLSVYVCLHVNVLTAHKSVSSFRHRDPEHALLPVSLWLASSLEGAEDSSNNAPLSQRNSLIYTLQVRAKKRAHPQRQYSHVLAGRCVPIDVETNTKPPNMTDFSMVSHYCVTSVCGIARFKDMATFSPVGWGRWPDTPLCTVACLWMCLRNRECRVWISRSQQGWGRGRRLSMARCFHRNPLIWRDAGHRGP